MMAQLDEELLLDLLLRWEELRAKGREIAVEELCREWPSLEPELRRRLEALEQTAWLEKPLDEPNDAGDTPLTVGGQLVCRGGGVVPRSPADQALCGQALAGRYRLDELIAEGGSGQVWRATDLELQRTVAVKIPRQLGLEAAERLLEEAKRVAGLNHPGIVPTFDVGRHGETVFVVSEFIKGGSLADVCMTASPSRSQIVTWIAELADALAYAHERGIVHRDIKPANILIDEHQRARLADFGIAQAPATQGQSLGTLDYTSPEQCRGMPVDHRSDLFSLAVVLFECLTGSLPEQPGKPTTLLMRGPATSGTSAWSVPFARPLPRQLRRICARGLEADASRRFPSADAMARALRAADSDRSRRRLVQLAAVLASAGTLVAIVAFNARSIGNVVRPRATADRLPAWADNDQPLESVLAAIAATRTGRPPTIEMFAAGPRDYDQRGGGVVAPSGEVYCLPSPEGVMLVVNPETLATRRVSSPLLSQGNFFGGVLAPDGCLYLMPHQATHFVKIDPRTDEVTAFGEASGDTAYWGGVVAGNGKIYTIPATASHVVEIDPDTLDIVRFGSLDEVPYKYAGGVLAPDGKIYCMPDQAPRIMVIDPESRSIEYLVEDLGDDASKAYGGVLAANGKIYSGVTSLGRVIVLDPRTDEISFIDGIPRDCYSGSVLGADGRIYAVPNNPGEVLVIDPDTGTASLLPDSRSTGGYWGAVLTPYGSIIAIPWEASRVLAIDFGSRLPDDWPLSRLFNRL